MAYSVRCVVVALAGASAVIVACGLDTTGTMDNGALDGATALDGNGQDVAVQEGGSQDVSSQDVTMTDGPGIDGPNTDGPADAAAMDVSSVDAQDSSMVDASTDTSALDAPPDAPCLIANGCITVPPGWNLVAIDGMQPVAACPTGFTQAGPTDVVEGPSAGPSACGCQACSTTSPPDCTSGAVGVFYDFGGGGCGSAGVPPQNNNMPAGACSTDMYMGNLNNFDLKYVPPGPTGGACTSAGQLDKQNVTYAARDRVCSPDNAAAAGCNGNECTPQLPPQYKACIAMAGNQSCPAPYTVKHRVGTDVTYTCGNCPCAVQAKCSGTMKLYTDNNCMNNPPQTMQVDNMCHPSGTSQGYRSYKYTGTVSNVMCSAGAAPPPQNLALVGESTICCAP